MKIAVVIVNYRTPEHVLACLKSLEAERPAIPGLRAVVVDNASGDNSADILGRGISAPEFGDWVEFLPLTLNGGFGWGNNQAILRLMGQADAPDAVLLLNPDTLVEPGAVAALIQAMIDRPDAGAIGAQLLNLDHSLSGSSFRFPSLAREFSRGLGVAAVERILGIAPTLVPYGEVGPVDWVTGACVLIRTQALREVGLFDTGFFLYFEEVELMHRLGRSGWKVYHCPESRIIHVAGASTGIVDGKAEGKSTPPRYLFESRRRYFALTRGAFFGLAAALLWTVGSVIGSTLAIVLRRPSDHGTWAEFRAMIAAGLLPTSRDARSRITSPGDTIDQPPAWMT